MNNLDILPVNEIIKKNYFIPKYQRGYRWTNTQVEDLLRDISSFEPEKIEDSENKTWYCLQPLVVKKCDAILIKENDLHSNEWYEVIDGQQRLTTIYLINQYFHEINKDIFPEMRLNYQTRKGSTEFLKKISFNEQTDCINKENIDYFHISTAYSTIHKWFKDKIETDTSFKLDDFRTKLLYHAKTIWYETIEIDTIAVFKRLNAGKIALTNSELVKALFLNSTNFIDDENGNNATSIKQIQIAKEWDEIEYKLHEPTFWYFIIKDKDSVKGYEEVRIDFILDLISKGNKDFKQSDTTFLFFNRMLKDLSSSNIGSHWLGIKNYYQTLLEWHGNRNLYHLIGFLLYFGDSIIELKELYNLSKTKAQFELDVVERIKSKLKFQLADLDYKKNKDSIRKVLLMHNLVSMMDNDDFYSRFPFDRFKEEKWDIEHINSSGEEIPKGIKHIQDWLNETKIYITDVNLLKRIENWSSDVFTQLYNDIILYFDQNNLVDKNGVENLTLLDSKTNRGYKNAVFPVKRKKIIERERQGTFIPLTTKNVFMKFYNQEVKQFTFWGKDDQEFYLNNLYLKLKKFLPIQNESND